MGNLGFFVFLCLRRLSSLLLGYFVFHLAFLICFHRLGSTSSVPLAWTAGIAYTRGLLIGCGICESTVDLLWGRSCGTFVWIEWYIAHFYDILCPFHLQHLSWVPLRQFLSFYVSCLLNGFDVHQVFL